MVGGWDNDDFLNALSPPSDDKSDREGRNSNNNHKNSNNSDDDDDQSKKVEDEPGSGSSKFKELLKAAEEAGDGRGGGFGLGISGRAIENPFLSQSTLSPPPPSPVVSNVNPDELSVEEQARRFREMMAQQQQGAAPPVLQDTIPPPPPRVAKTDRAGRPVGRNRDADSIANTADVYFAQLKRDSTVRTIARLRGEEEVAEQVFADEGIKELGELLVKNPYLQG